MKQTKLFLSLAMAIVTSIGMAGCNRTQQQQNATADTQQLSAVESVETTPVATWQTTIDEYLVNVIGQRIELNNTLVVPFYSVVAVDSSDGTDYRVWGDWWLYAYDNEGETLITSLSVCAPGLFHLQKNSSGFRVTKFEEVEEGRAIDENAHRIFGKYCDTFWEFHDNTERNDSLRHVMMSEYVRLNNLPYTKLMLDSAKPTVQL